MTLTKPFKAGLVFIFIYLMFILTAYVEYNSTLDSSHRQAKDDLLIVQTRMSNILDSRINSASNIKTFIQSNKNFDQADYNRFVKEIYDSPNNLIRNITFIKDTTISHVYPYQDNQESIGTDLATVEAQKNLILYAKANEKVVVTAPVDLVEGGQGIIVRLPFTIDGQYYGQAAIVFDYDVVMKQAGIEDLSKDHFLVLSHWDPIQENQHVIWSNTDPSQDSMDASVINVYDFSLLLEIMPKSGWRGDSPLFILVLILGHILAISGYIIVYNSLTSKEKLLVFYTALEEANLHLEATNNQLIASEQDLTHRYEEMEMQKAQIQYLADRDPLTGLYNRRKFIADLEVHLKQEEGISVVLFDIDNFKTINDTRGHQYGDQILSLITQWLDGYLPIYATPYRIGGDEFVIYIPHSAVNGDVKRFMRQLFDGFKKLKVTSKIKEPITLSAGIAQGPDHGNDVETLMMKADLAMYASKNTGKNKYVFFDESMSESLKEKVNIESLLRAAVKHEDFFMLYQPIIDTKTLKVYGYEALIRMKESRMSPAVFIPVAEEIGLISHMGKWVITEVLRQMQEWKKMGLSLKPVAINMSPSQIYEGGIENYLKEEIQTYGIDPALIEIEVTENIFFSNTKSNISTLEKIKALGCTIALDDFGSGFSSLSYLTYMPVHKVKLDKSLKDQFLPQEELQVMEGLIGFCHSLNLKVVTEGVEDYSEVRKLVDQKSDYLQGYVFSKPLEAPEAAALMDHHYHLPQNI